MHQKAALNPQIAALNRLGQSIWYDNLSRDVLQSGELAGYVGQGISGLTSNPAIFKNAIADTGHYDSVMRAMAAEGLSSEQICEALMIEDVGQAADLLRPCFDASKGADGYASIEVSPLLAADTARTIEAGQTIFSRLKRPNIMIKVPATAEGLPAVSELLAQGVNVNVTLIFSVEVYEQVVEAYLSGLEKRQAAGKDLSQIASVASFFVSRVDSICEKRFDELLKAGKVGEADKAIFFGKAGIANSKLAYAAYERLFSSARFRALRDRGARVQRPLWASTGTKNPAFSPVLYVEELAGRDTVNTIPPATLKALLGSGRIEARLHQGGEEAAGVISSLKSLGIDFDACLRDLRVQGVKLFADAYNELLASIEKKRAGLRA